MKRWAVLPLFAVAGVLLSGCPAPPPSWKPPVVDSVAISPDPVSAGETFTVTVTATDDHQVAEMRLELVLPGNPGGTSIIECEGAFTPQPTVTVEHTCTLPDFAPNGTWRVDVYVYDAEYYLRHFSDAQEFFEVVGGSNDTSPPERQLVTVSPDPVVVGSTVTTTFRVFDEHLADYDTAPRLRLSGPSYERDCTQITSQRLSPTVHEWVFECEVAATATPGSYMAVARLHDALGYEGQLRAEFPVIAAP